MVKKKLNNKNVLVSVLKSRSDRRILFCERWYRIPLAFLPKRKFKYVAFYQPAVFGRHGKRIEYYARVSRRKVYKRIKLLPEGIGHPRAKDDYLKLEFKELKKLPRPVRNIVPRRVSFGFTTLKNLLSSRNILELYDIMPTEEIIGRCLRRWGIKALSEFPVSACGKRFRLDFAIVRRNRRLAIECDNKKAHAGKLQKRRDRVKDFCLRRAGWRVIRLKEREIIENAEACLRKIQKAAR
ncbi:MAG: hypothetical protein UY32_C0012G0011 [Candidatus Jorgensenbacteria bacterium GW2011_GWC1_48_8]|nr:MAG: hypothetical protein UY32_C0012G0011 [Candidatus Jorgensenbacteria bacterium GW2011_GWC1_48_8]